MINTNEDYYFWYKKSLIDKENLFHKMFILINSFKNNLIKALGNNTFYLEGFGTVRNCINCGKWMLGGPTKCWECLEKMK